MARMQRWWRLIAVVVLMASVIWPVAAMRPDGSIVKGDGTFTPGGDTTTTDASGNLTYRYQLDGIQGGHEARVYPAAWGGDWGVAALASVTLTNAPGPITITLSSQETLWVDANKCNAEGPRGAWLSFIISNTGADAVTDVRITFSGFTGAYASYFRPPTDLTRTFSTLQAGEAKPVYFYIDYSDVCSHPQGGGSPYTGYTANYAITVTSTELAPVVRNSTVTTNELLTANAAGVALNSVLGPGSYVGQLLTQTVQYSFGNNADLFFQPAAEAGFDDACLRLVGSQITAVSGTVSPALVGLEDRLWFPTASVPAGGGTISVTYAWQVLCVNRVQTLHPWAAAKSGQKYKYTGLAASTILPAATSSLTIGKLVTPNLLV